jgi:hypothetical protein
MYGTVCSLVGGLSHFCCSDVPIRVNLELWNVSSGTNQLRSRMCELPHVSLRPASRYEHGAPWYFVNIADALLAFMTEEFLSAIDQVDYHFGSRVGLVAYLLAARKMMRIQCASINFSYVVS